MEASLFSKGGGMRIVLLRKKLGQWLAGRERSKMLGMGMGSDFNRSGDVRKTRNN